MAWCRSARRANLCDQISGASRYTGAVKSSALDTTTYRRCARRIRWAHRHDPLARARSLRQLSDAFDSRQAVARPDVGAAVRAFTRSVEAELDGPTLRYSQRLKLLTDAQRHGIRRFDANLIIAAVLDRANSIALNRENPEHQNRARAGRPCHAQGLGCSNFRTGSSNLIGIAMFFVIVESLICAGGWWLMWS